MRALALTVLLAVAACSSSSSSSDTSPASDGGSTANDAASAFPAAHTALPLVVNEGGPVMTVPKFVAITFPGDTLATSIADFSSKIGAGSYWSSVVSEYGVGPGTSTAVQMTTSPAATLTDDDIQAFLKAQIGTTLPEPDVNTLYALYYPQGVTVTMQGGTSCQAFGAYHGDIALPGGKFAAYAVLPRCPSPFPGVTVLDQLTGATSHEYVEAATDPIANEKPAWGNADVNGGGWALAGGGAEVGDMCAELGDVFFRPADVGYLVQRTWSNAAATAGHDPCVPSTALPYFNAAPVLPDTVKLDIGTGHQQQLSVVHIAVGQSQTIELDLFSDGPTAAPWVVSALDFSSALSGGAPELAFKFDKNSGQNGDKLNLTITALAKDPKGFAAFFIQSQSADASATTTYWVALVQN